MKYLLTFEAHTGRVESDKQPRDHQWTGGDMTTSDVPQAWTYEETPENQVRKPRDRKPEIEARKRKRHIKSMEDRANKNSVDINLNNDIKTFKRKTKTPGKAG